MIDPLGGNCSAQVFRRQIALFLCKLCVFALALKAAAADGTQDPGTAEQVPIFEIDGSVDCSVNYRDDLRADILREMARVLQCTVDLPESVEGRVSLKLRHVDVLAVFDAVLSPLGLTFFRDGNVIKIVDRKAPAPVVSVKFQPSFIDSTRFTEFVRSEGYGTDSRDRMEFAGPIVTVWTTWRRAERIKACMIGWDQPRSNHRGAPRFPPVIQNEVIDPIPKTDEEIADAAFETRMRPHPEKTISSDFYWPSHVDARLVAKRVQALLLPGRDEITVLLCHNALRVRSDRVRLGRVSRVVRFLDDAKWYPEQSSQSPSSSAGGGN